MKKNVNSVQTTEVPIEIVWLLRRADGFTDLRMLDHAARELEAVPESYRGLMLYKQLSLRLALERQSWDRAAELADFLRDTQPRQPLYWIQLAYATRRFRGIEPALSILRDALRRFPQEAVIPFNLACYECQLGHAGEARRYLERAIQLDPECRDAALEDEDLSPLWGELER